MIPILSTLFQEIDAEGTLPHLFYEASRTLIPKLDNDITGKENYRPVRLRNADTDIINNQQIKSN